MSYSEMVSSNPPACRCAVPWSHLEEQLDGFHLGDWSLNRLSTGRGSSKEREMEASHFLWPSTAFLL